MPTLDQPSAPAPSVALIGFMGAGKSTVGALVAAELGWPFVDLDTFLEREIGPIPAFFKAHGEPAFRDLETAALLHLAKGPPIVLAAGGGTPCRPENRVLLEGAFDTVFLDVDLETIAGRIDGEDRPLWGRAKELFIERHPVYSTARHRIPAQASPERVAQMTLRALGRQSLHVDLAKPYAIELHHDFKGLKRALEERNYDRWVVVTDDRVGPLWLAPLLDEIGPSPVVTFANGEANKTLTTWMKVVDGILDTSPTRRTAVLALGGGVVGDMAGFAASTCNRGLPFLQIPTTTLSMIDSSVGGKTGVNHLHGKNLVGAFHQPELVWIPLSTLTTLDSRHLRAGIAEAVKIAATHSLASFAFLEAAGQRVLSQPRLLNAVVRNAIRSKAAVVARDEREAGERKLLNAGHTIGHGLERSLGYGTLLHGEAVAIGMVLESLWAADEGLAEPEISSRLVALFKGLGLPIRWPVGTDPDAFRQAVAVDKKAVRDTLVLPHVTRLGHGSMVTRKTNGFVSSILELIRSSSR